MSFKCPICQTILKETGKDYHNVDFRLFYCNNCGYGEWIDIKTRKDHNGKKYE